MQYPIEEQIYELFDLYLSEKINACSFCDEYHRLYNLELDYSKLSKTEKDLFSKLEKISSRFSESSEDFENYPDFFYSESILKKTVEETRYQALTASTKQDRKTLVFKIQTWAGQFPSDNQRLKYDNIDNSVWTVSVDLKNTPLEYAKFKLIDVKNSSDDWYYCDLVNGKFEGACGIDNLENVLNEFITWITKTNNKENRKKQSNIIAKKKHTLSQQNPKQTNIDRIVQFYL